MSTYFVAIRIADKTVNGDTYAERRQSVIDNIYEEGQGYWDEMTSFFIVSSDLNTTALAGRAASGLSEDDDLLIVFDPEDMSLGYFGPFEHPLVLTSFFKGARKV